jgi:Tol biopolymer transport system component
MTSALVVACASLAVWACQGEVLDLGGDAGQATAPLPLTDAAPDSVTDGGTGSATDAVAGNLTDAAIGPPTVVPGPAALANSSALDADAPGATGWILFDSDAVGMVRHIFAVRSDDGSLMQLTFGGTADQEPAVSPDGSTVVFSSNRSADDSFQLYALDMAASSVKQLTAQTGGAGQPTFSPDGTTIAYHSGYALWLMAADGSNARQLVDSQAGPGSGGYEHAAFTPDGKTIVVDRENEIDGFDRNGQNEISIVENGTQDELYPAISPDGTFVAFVASCNAPGDANVMIATMATPGAPACSARTWNAPTWGVVSHPSWGPAAWIAFAHLSSNGLHRVAISDENQQVFDMVEDQGDQLDPSWAPSTFNLN